MIISIKIADETYEKYGKKNPSNPRSAIEAHIERFVDADNGKTIVLNGKILAELQRLSGRQLDSPQDVLAAFVDLASYSVDGVQVILPGEQRAILRKGAEAYKEALPAFIERKVKQGLTTILGA